MADRPTQEKVVKEWGGELSCPVAKKTGLCNGVDCDECPVKHGGKLIIYVPIPLIEGYVEAQVGDKIDPRWMYWTGVRFAFFPDDSRRFGEIQKALDLFAIRPDYPKVEDGYELIVAADMPGDEEIPSGLWAYYVDEWLGYCPTGRRWKEANHTYFRRRLTLPEPKTFADEYVREEPCFPPRILSAQAVAKNINRFVEMRLSLLSTQWELVRNKQRLVVDLLNDECRLDCVRWKPEETK